MPSNKGIVITAPRHAEIKGLPYPKPRGADWVVVKATALAVNPTDWYHVDLDGVQSCEGCVTGFDFAGRVVETAPGAVHSFKLGDRVFGSTLGSNVAQKSDGCFAEYFQTKTEVLSKTPDNLTDEEAASQGVGIHTVGQSFYKYLKLPFLPAQVGPAPIFIYGGSTAMGICGIQFAKLAGLTVITTASPSNAEYLRGLGADFVIDYHSPTLVEDIRQVISRDLELAWDCRPSEDSAALCAELLSANGNAKYNTLIGYTADIVKKLNPAVETSATWGYTAFGEPWFWEEEEPAVPEDFELAKQMVKISPELLAQGKLKPPRIYLDRGGRGLEGVLQGIDELRNNRVSGGKLVYTM